MRKAVFALKGGSEIFDGIKAAVSAAGKRFSSRRKGEREGAAGGIKPILAFLRAAALLFAMTTAAVIAVAAGMLARIAMKYRFDVEKITGAERSVLVYDAGGELIAAVSGERKRIPIPLSALSEKTKLAFISAEDARFYEHSGVDIIRIFGAAWSDVKALELREGASTIGQQLIKLSHLSGEKTFERKLAEVYLTVAMERSYTKDEILEMYLNYVYFGGGFYGIEAASLGYFGVHASELTTAQAAQLAGVLKAPSTYAPHLDAEKSLGRRSTVLALMEQYGYLSSEESAAAKAEPCVLKNAFPSGGGQFVSFALDEAADALSIGREELIRSGCRIHTTLDRAAADRCNALMADDSLFPCEAAQGALVLLGKDGAILALNGSRAGEGREDSFDRAADMERQPGSLTKPILCYAPAIDRFGYTAATVLEDAEKQFGEYKPHNAGGRYRGFVTLREAVSESLNIPAVELLEAIGVENGVAFAEGLGLSFENEFIGLPLALGGFTRGVSPLEMAAAYNAFNTGGEYFRPYSVQSIERDGDMLYLHAAEPTRAMRPETAFIMSDVLRTATQTGTASALDALRFPIAAKTGTALDETGGVRDVWTAAFAGDFTACCWIGVDSAALGTLPEGTTGGSSACILIRELFASLPPERTAGSIAAPEGVLRCRLDRRALKEGHRLLLATDDMGAEEILNEYFCAGTEPTGYDPIRLPPQPPREVLWRMDADGDPVIVFTAEDERLEYAILRSGAEEGEAVLLARIGGRQGEVAYTDRTAAAGGTYFYSVVAVNPTLSADGGRNESAPSRKMRIVVLF